VVGVSSNTDYMTPEEVKEVEEAAFAVIERFHVRRGDPSLRPEGSRPVTIVLSATVAPKKP
jgi:hypothetical protein